MKQQYETPQITELGSVLELTLASTSGDKYDGSLVFGAPLSTPHQMS